MQIPYRNIPHSYPLKGAVTTSIFPIDFRLFRPKGKSQLFAKWAIISFYYDFGASGVRGSIRLVFRVALELELRKVVVK